MRVVIIGGSGHWHIVTDAQRECPDLEIVGIAPGRQEEDLTDVCTALPGTKVCPDWRTLLKEPEIDYAVVNPWFCDAARISASCLEAGLNVYSEKPLATEMADLLHLEKVWRDSGRALGGMLNYRWSEWFLALRSIVEAGEIGQIRQIHAQKSYRMGQRPDFYRHRATMGGLLPWVGIHGIDWLTAFGGEVQWISAAHSRAENRGHGEMEVSSAALMELENGVIGTVTADYFRPTGSARHDDDRLRITGTRGMAEAVDGRVYLENESPRREVPLPGAKNAFLAFADAVKEGRGADFAMSALHITRAALMARESADEGGTRKGVCARL